MQLILCDFTCLLHKYLCSDIILHGTMSKLHIYIDLMYHALLGCTEVCLSCNGLYVMCEGLPVMHEGSVCHMPWLQL